MFRNKQDNKSDKINFVPDFAVVYEPESGYYVRLNSYENLTDVGGGTVHFNTEWEAVSAVYEFAAKRHIRHICHKEAIIYG